MEWLHLILTASSGQIAPSFVTRSPAAEYLAVYTESQFPKTKVVSGLGVENYQDKIVYLRTLDYYPISIQCGGDPRFGDVPRFVGIFQEM